MAKSRLCSIDGCGKPHDSKGYCKAHYHRLSRHGDPLGGGTSHGEPLRFIHEVAIRHAGAECLTWPFGKNADGYGKIHINGKLVGTHRYVCELVHGAPPTPSHEAAHSCGKGHEACIAPEHLSWKTPAENEADKLEHGTHNRRERHGLAKLTESQAREILAMKGKETKRDLAERFGVSYHAVYDIHNGRRWASIS